MARRKHTKPPREHELAVHRFAYDERRSVRVVVLDGEPWVACKDIADLTNANLLVMLSQFGTEEYVQIDPRYLSPEKPGVMKGPGPMNGRGLYVMTESGLLDSLDHGPGLYDEDDLGRIVRKWVIKSFLPAVRAFLATEPEVEVPAVCERRVTIQVEQPKPRRAPQPARPHSLYRFFGGDGALLYVGISCSLAQRLSQHQHSKDWWGDVTEIRHESFPDRQAVLTAELEAIRSEGPVYNVIHNRRSA